MTTDPDKLLADAIARLKSIDDRYPGPQSTPLSTGLMFAGVLLATRRELAEVKAIVGTVKPPPTMRDIAHAAMAATGVRVAEQPADPRPLEPVLAPHPSSLARCADCGNDRWKQLGHLLCARCQERDALKAALREACDLLDPHARSDADRARIAELRRLL